MEKDNKKDSYWFRHDSNARQDPKIIALIAKYGMMGYGIWWSIVETLRDQDGYRYDISTKFSYPSLAEVIKMTVPDTQQFIKDCIEEFDLLEKDDTYIWSDSLINRMSSWDKKKERMVELGKAGAKKRWNGDTGEAQADEKQKRKKKVPPPVYTEQQLQSFAKFQEWIRDNASNVGKMKQPFKIEQYLQLFSSKEIPQQAVFEYLQKMHNYAPLVKNNVSAYLTLKNWYKRDNPDTGNPAIDNKRKDLEDETRRLAEEAS